VSTVHTRTHTGRHVHPRIYTGRHTRLYPTREAIPLYYTHQGGYTTLLYPPREAILSPLHTQGGYSLPFTHPREAYPALNPPQGGISCLKPTQGGYSHRYTHLREVILTVIHTSGRLYPTLGGTWEAIPHPRRYLGGMYPSVCTREACIPQCVPGRLYPP